MTRWLLLLALPLTGCIDLFEGVWFNPEPLEAYGPWPAQEIDDDHLQLVELQGTAIDGDAPRLFGVWLNQCTRDGAWCLAGSADCSCAAPAADEYDPELRDNVVLYFHGNGGNLTSYFDRMQMLWRLGVSVFAVDYRGYGMSTGAPTEAGIYADARTARDEVLRAVVAERPQLAGDEGELPSSLVAGIGVYGWSLGSTAAIDLAVEDPPRAVVTESALASAQAFVDDATGLGISSTVLMDTRFDNVAKIPFVASPKLLLHGTEDDFVRFEFSSVLFDAALDPKALVPVPGADHGNVPCPTRDPDLPSTEVPCVADARWLDAVGAFFAERLP